MPLPELKSREAMLQKFLPPGIAENLNYLELAKQLEVNFNFIKNLDKN